MINYFNYVHLVTLIAAAGFVAAIYFPLRNRSIFAKEVALFSLMILNLTQHLFKSFFWPHLWGSGFGIINTAYNVCAILIISSPFVLLSGNNLLKQFVAYVGTIGPAVTLMVPYWFVGQTVFTWEFARFWTCHTLLVATSLLPALWGMVKFNRRDGWKFGLVFIAMLTLILANDAVFLLVLGQATTETLYSELSARNPLWTMGPFGGIESLKYAFEVLSPGFLREPYIPVLWYAIPLYLYITAIAYLLGRITDRRRQQRAVPLTG